MSDDYDPFDDDYYDDDGEGPPCPRCDGDGIVNCYCGGDQCFCENHGEKDCPLCYGEGVADPARAEKYLESEREMMAVMRKAWKEAAAKDKEEKSDV
ncbi:MAG TPA: hypothetical protein VKA94_01280 [Hyphomicrobiales bacterium]|nr:hypothetical protein [Hyphomicrobiales bacterium]